MTWPKDLSAWSDQLEDRYCMYQMEEGEHDAAREALRSVINDEPIDIHVSGSDDPSDGRVVRYRGIYIGNIWPPDDWDASPAWGNYPAPIIRVDDETPITAGYSFSEGYDEAVMWFVDRLRKIGRGEWKRGDGR